MSFSLHPTVSQISYYIRLTVCLAILAAAGCVGARAQIVRTDSVAGGVISSDSIRKAFDNGPYFGLYNIAASHQAGDAAPQLSVSVLHPEVLLERA